MEGKHIVVIGGGSYRMRTMWPDAEGYGIKVIIVESNPNHISRDLVHCFVEYDFSDHTIDHVHASEIISLLRRRDIKADGCISFCNECTPLAALICEQLELRGTAKRMPSFLPDDSRNQLIDAAFKCCLGIGLTDGTFNVEFIMTANGPKLLEINPRMCGYIFRDWILKLYGIDIMLYTMMISCGIKPEIPNSSTDTIQMGVMVIPSLHGKLLTDDHYKSKLNEMIDSGDVFFLQFLQVDDFWHVSTYDKLFGNVAVSGSNPIEVKRKLMNVCRALDIDQHDYQVDTFIRNF